MGADPLEAPNEKAWQRLLPRLDAHYRSTDEDRYLLERSMEVSSREMRELHHTISVERAHLANILTNLPQAVLVLDGDTVSLANDAANTLLGRAVLKGAFVDEVLLFLRDGSPIALSEALLPTSSTLHVRSASGSTVPVDVAQASLDHGHRLITLTDLRERLAAEEALSEARVSAEVARRAEQTRASFLARMSHELRTPLNAIIGYSEMLMDEASASLRSDLARIQSAGSHLLGLINDILDLSKVDAGKMELDLQPTDLATLVQDVGQDLQPVVEKQGNLLRIHAEPGTVQIVDRVKLKQCLYNLVGNAARYTDHGRIDLRLVLSDEHVTLTVSDTGTGIHPADIATLFDPFVQSRQHRGGTGLGLAVVKAMTELMGGGCTVQSTLGKGSTFVVTLPRRDPAPADAG